MKKLYTYLPLLAIALVLVSCVEDDVDVLHEFYYPSELAILEKNA